MILRYTATVGFLTIFCCTYGPVFASEPEPAKIDSHLSDDYADLEAWAQSSKADDTQPSEAIEQHPVRMVRTYVVACEGNLPDSPNSLGTMCPRALTMCTSTPDPKDLGYWVFTAPAKPGGAQRHWQATGEFACRSAADPAGPAAVAVQPVVTAEDFRRLPIPAAVIKVQPPDRRTLINIPTNLYANASPVILPTTVLGLAVRVRATPSRFHWTYGDGTARTTTDPGAPYPELRTAHTYLRPGHRTLHLSTTYSGEYSVAGEAWLPIDGVATVSSPSRTLTVLSAQNQLVAEPLG